MLVKELIAKLQELPEYLQDAPVLCTTEIGLMNIDLQLEKVVKVGSTYEYASAMYKEDKKGAFYACVIDYC